MNYQQCNLLSVYRLYTYTSRYYNRRQNVKSSVKIINKEKFGLNFPSPPGGSYYGSLTLIFNVEFAFVNDCVHFVTRQLHIWLEINNV